MKLLFTPSGTQDKILKTRLLNNKLLPTAVISKKLPAKRDKCSQFLHLTWTVLSFAGMAKIAPWCLARRESFTAKEQGPVLRHQRFLLILATVRGN
jgi:hypothetical protein